MDISILPTLLSELGATYKSHWGKRHNDDGSLNGKGLNKIRERMTKATFRAFVPMWIDAIKTGAQPIHPKYGAVKLFDQTPDGLHIPEYGKPWSQIPEGASGHFGQSFTIAWLIVREVVTAAEIGMEVAKPAPKKRATKKAPSKRTTARKSAAKGKPSASK